MLHPRNTEFTWQQPMPPYQLITSEQANAYREVGGFVLEDVFGDEELSSLLVALDPIEAEANDRLADVPENQPSIGRTNEIVFSAHVVLRSDEAKTFAQHRVFAQLCHDLIGSRSRLYWDQLVYKRPGTVENSPGIRITATPLLSLSSTLPVGLR